VTAKKHDAAVPAKRLRRRRWSFRAVLAAIVASTTLLALDPLQFELGRAARHIVDLCARLESSVSTRPASSRPPDRPLRCTTATTCTCPAAVTKSSAARSRNASGPCCGADAVPGAATNAI